MRLDPATIELMNAEIDGENTESRSASLREILEEDPAARAHFVRLRRLCDSLDRDEETVPPPGLRAEIMNALRAGTGEKDRPAGTHSGWWPQVRFALRYSYAFAAGLILGIIGYSLSSSLSPVISNGKVTGTMGVYESADGHDGTWDLVPDTAGITGQARVKQSRGEFFVEFDIGASGPLDVTLSFDPAALEFGGFGNERGAAQSLSVSPGEVNWSQEGRQRAYVHFIPRESAPAEVTARLVEPGREAYIRTFRLGGGE